MALGIYKAGQGYWVRILTAVAAGLLVLATAAWAFAESALINLPVARFIVTVEPIDVGSVDTLEGRIEVGDEITLRQFSEEEGEAVDIGTATVDAVEAAQAGDVPQLIVTFAPPALMGEGNSVGFATELARGQFVGAVDRVEGVPIIEQLYVQGLMAGIALFVGLLLIYWLVGLKRVTGEFLIATDGEMRKVTWPSVREVRSSTVTIIIATIILAALLFGIDFLFQTFFTRIGVLQR